VTAIPPLLARAKAPLDARRIAAFVASVAVIAGWWWWWRSGAAPAVSYVTEPIDRGAIEVVVTATGIVNPVTKVQVGTYVSGPILQLFADYNSPVTKGQRVAQIDPRPFQVKAQQAEALLANAQASVAKARADLALKKLAFERNQALHARNLIAENDLDTARSNYEQAKAQVALEQAGVQQAEAFLAEARINLGYTDITSPVDGVVVSRSVDVGQTVAASFQTPTLFEIAEDLTKMQVNAAVSESDIGGVADGQKARFTVDAYPGRRFDGRVAQVRNAPVTVQNVVTYDVVIEVANADLALKPGMTATVEIETARRDDAIRIPQRALRFHPEEAGARDPNAAAVWRQGVDGALERVAITPGLRNETWVELAQGALAAGDAVVVARERTAADEKPKAAQSPFSPARPPR
jgi:HlyD family secretion protein